ncbi:hypothetical protein ACFWGD_10770 [Corynebacterium sp. NPDC060344]|uniref:hypothetical protein n=1 Tax=Corynebacterium sp. NPDC060344 TaxID=3347101 RepID=UPI003655B45C
MNQNRFRSTARTVSTGRMVAALTAVALAATVAPIAIAKGMSAGDDGGGHAIETTRSVTLGGDDAAFEATFDVRDGDPECEREFSLTVGAHQFACGDVVIETRSAGNVEDLERFGIRAVRAKILADDPAPDMSPAETPHAPGLIAWSGSPVEGSDGVVHAVIVLGDDTDPATAADSQSGAGSYTGSDKGSDSDSDSDSDEAPGGEALVAVISADPDIDDPYGAVEDAAATILADVREGGAR